jgi:hypothetical protein
MNTTLDYLKSNRKWLVKDFRVWGAALSFEADLLMTETTGADSRVVFHHRFVGDIGQMVEFADLVDHRGNPLPESISNPEIFIIPKNLVATFIPGAVGQTSFRIARSGGEPDEAVVDLLIMEMN